MAVKALHVQTKETGEVEVTYYVGGSPFKWETDEKGGNMIRTAIEFGKEEARREIRMALGLMH